MATRLGHGATHLRSALSGAMQAWERSRDSGGRRDLRRARPVCDFVAISRRVGAGGGRIARDLSTRIGWPVFDRELLQEMAGDDEHRKQLYDWMDERDASWLEQTLKYLVVGRYPPQDYVSKLSRTVLALARGAPAIFVGRGADLILPADVGLRVRVVAPLEQRIRAYAAQNYVDEPQARAEVERIDRERAEFLRRRFKAEIDDPTRCDVTINTARVRADEAVEVIETLLRHRAMLLPVAKDMTLGLRS